MQALRELGMAIVDWQRDRWAGFGWFGRVAWLLLWAFVAFVLIEGLRHGDVYCDDDDYGVTCGDR